MLLNINNPMEASIWLYSKDGIGGINSCSGKLYVIKEKRKLEKENQTLRELYKDLKNRNYVSRKHSKSEIN